MTSRCIAMIALGLRHSATDDRPQNLRVHAAVDEAAVRRTTDGEDEKPQQ
jgi:hypothetical protein